MLKIERLSVAPGVELKPVTLDDATALSALISTNMAHLVTFLPQVATLAHPAAAREHLASALEAAADGSVYEWHIVSNDILCGAIRVNHIDHANKRASVAYYIGSSHQGQGLATQSVRAVIAWCFEQLGLNRIELRCTSENLASQRLAKRVGFTWEGMLRQIELQNGVFVDHFVYGLLKEEFRERSEAAKAA